jgi:hypothetical protein
MGKDFLSLAGPGFRDFTRIAASDPKMWRDILLANREELLASSRRSFQRNAAGAGADDRQRQRRCAGRPDQTRPARPAPAGAWAPTPSRAAACLTNKRCSPPSSWTSRRWPARQARSRCRAPRAFPTACCCWPACAEGTTIVHDLLDSDDTRVMLGALRSSAAGSWRRKAPWSRVTGLGGRLPQVKPARLFMGNAGTAMRPLTAALAVLGGEGELHAAACRACTSAPSATWSTRCASWAARSTTSASPATRRCACGQPGLRLDAPHPGARRRVQPVPDRLLMALPLVARARRW